MLRKKQATADVILSLPLLRNDGTQASGLTLGTLSTKIIKPDGTALSGYTEATFTEPGGDGVYVCKFPAGAETKAFNQEDQANPYVVTLDSSTEDVEPTTVEVWIASQYPWASGLETTLTAIKGSGWSDETLVDIRAAIAALVPPAYSELILVQNQEIVLSGQTGPFKIKKNDRLPALTIQLLNGGDNSAIDLTEASSVKVYMKNKSTGTLKINGSSATVTDAANGRVKYSWAAADTDTAGSYLFEFKIDWGSSIYQTVPAQTVLQIEVVEDLAG